jgi:hypothetical protein
MDKDALLAFDSPNGEFVMLNLYRLKAGMEFAVFLKQMQVTGQQAFAKARAETIYAGVFGGEFVTGDKYWDTVVMLSIPTGNRCAACSTMMP